jgi:hypothetical protein
LARTGRDRAVLFATDDYDDPALRDLVNPIADARAIAAELHDRYGFDVEVVENPSRADIYAALGRQARTMDGEDDQLFVFFAGHGSYIGDDEHGRGYIIPKDGRQNDRSTWFSYADLGVELDDLPAHRVLLVLDVCHGGSFVSRYRNPDPPYGTATPAVVFQRHAAYRARLVLTSGSRSDYVSDGVPGRHSPFAFHLLRALRSYGGPNEDGLLTSDELAMYAMDVEGPTPIDGGFGGNEPGSKFFFVSRELR